MENRLYWPGNSAKTIVIDEILRRAGDVQNEEILIFDYGCGGGGDWPAVLTDYPRLHLVGYDPDRKSYQTAGARLKGLKADIFTGNELQTLSFKADFIVSFSVFEHVYDRRRYLQTARKHLAEYGIFFLNYDDGHFRNTLDLNAPGLWPGQLKAWLHNLLAEPLARVGRTHLYQARVNRSRVDKLVSESGFQVVKAFYSNLGLLKGMFKTIPDDRREDFTRLWLDLESELNASFLVESRRETWGDTANLWQFMVSRTLVLCHKQAPD
jgi:SAM-dependent methyltransferase